MSAKPSSAVQAQGSPHLRHQRSWAVRRPTAQGQASGHFQSAKQPGPCHCPPCLVLLAAEHLTPGLVSEVQRIQWSPEPRRPNAWTPCPGSRPRATRCSWPFFKNARQTSQPKVPREKPEPNKAHNSQSLVARYCATSQAQPFCNELVLDCCSFSYVWFN